MITKIAEFTVKQEKLTECIAAIEEFIAEIKKHEPHTLFYDSYQKPDKVSFVHLMVFYGQQAEEFHRNTPHVQKFVSILYPNCMKEPAFIDLTLIASKQNRPNI